ncbi:hypothetical protein [Actinosynnema sp. NPDC023587]|uniref:hypothetical protein n=1 Tax=Actinosynnema sp. NPDC023587 TaxID=3154695 RepID=UPI0033CD426F
MPVLRWFRDRGRIHRPALDTEIPQATGYRYLHEGIDVLADRAPDSREVLERQHDESMTRVMPDGTLVACECVAGWGPR